MGIRAILAGGLIAVGGVAIAQDVPVARKEPPPDVVVTGEVPQIQDGLWRVRRWPRRLVSFLPDGPSTGQTVQIFMGGTTDLCVADGRAEAAFVDLLNDQNHSFGCSGFHIRVDRGRLRGSLTCRRMTDDGPLTATDHFRGTMTLQRVDVRVESSTARDGESLGESTMRLEANRIGACAPAGRAVAVPPPSPPPPVQAVAEAPPPASVPPLPSATITAPGVAESANDVVVVARRLSRLRLKYASSGRILRWCRPAISSGDGRVDRAGCAIVRACVRAGFGDPGPDIACFRRTVDLLEADQPPPP